MARSKLGRNKSTSSSGLKSKLESFWRDLVKLPKKNMYALTFALLIVLVITGVGFSAQNNPRVIDSTSSSTNSPESEKQTESAVSASPKASASPKSSPTSSAQPVYADNWLGFEQPLSTCQLQETQNITGAGAKGFPARQSIPSTGNIKIAIIPVDFSNAVGSGDPQTLFRDDVNQMISWAQYFSRGKLSYEVDLSATSWVRAPRGADWYTCTACGKGSSVDKQPREVAIQELITAADPIYDFTGVDYVYFVLPEEAELQYGTAPIGGGNFNSNEGQFFALAYGEMGAGTGYRGDRTRIWDHVVHEILHPQGFIGHGPSNGSGYYISSDNWGASKAVTSWEAFLNGWFDSNEVLCLDKDSLNKEVFISLDTIDNFGAGKESAMIRLNAQEILIVERRGPGPFTTLCSTCYRPTESGFTAYKVNVNAAHYRDDSDPNGDSKNFWSYLGPQGKPIITSYVEYSGVKVTRISDTQVKISVS
ncbi:MAG: immune inhibitor A [Rhodoluna sp.]|nr:immune inhibitor A [Rhodoluna sp.]